MLVQSIYTKSDRKNWTNQPYWRFIEISALRLHSGRGCVLGYNEGPPTQQLLKQNRTHLCAKIKREERRSQINGQRMEHTRNMPSNFYLGSATETGRLVKLKNQNIAVYLHVERGSEIQSQVLSLETCGVARWEVTFWELSTCDRTIEVSKCQVHTGPQAGGSNCSNIKLTFTSNVPPGLRWVW